MCCCIELFSDSFNIEFSFQYILVLAHLDTEVPGVETPQVLGEEVSDGVTDGGPVNVDVAETLGPHQEQSGEAPP